MNNCKSGLCRTGETGAIIKKGRHRLKISLVYPNTYAVGMANLGFQAVYGLCNAFNDVFCERVFYPSFPSAAASPKTLETGRLAADADIIAFSLGFENDYPNVLTMLKLCGLPLLSCDREQGRFPLVLAGGVAGFLNPEPLANFFDAYLLGEAEANLPQFLQMWNPKADKTNMLDETAKAIPSFYVPALHPKKITPAQMPSLTGFDTESQIIAKDTAFDDTFLIETGRGCPHHCRFCSAGAIYYPPRFRKLAQIKASIARGLVQTNHIGLVGAAVSDFPHIEELVPVLDKTPARVSFSSFRADAITDDFLQLLLKSGVKTATIAPEAGSQRMRNIIRKDLTEKQILSAAQTLSRGGILNLKLYFMIGLPFETEADIDAIIDLCQKIKSMFMEESRSLKRLGKISVTINAFVPKPATPFQWCAMEDMASLKAKLKRLKRDITKIPNMSVSGDTSNQALLQGFLARADRRAGDFLLSLQANHGNLPQTFKAYKSLTAEFLGPRAKNDPLPWDFVTVGRGKNYLWKEFEAAQKVAQAIS